MEGCRPRPCSPGQATGVPVKCVVTHRAPFALRGPIWGVTCGWWALVNTLSSGGGVNAAGLLPAGPVTNPVNSVSLWSNISSRRIYSAVSVVAILADHWRQFKSGWEWKCNAGAGLSGASWWWRCELVLEVWAGGGGENWWWRWELVWASGTHVSPSHPCTIFCNGADHASWL